MIQHNHEQHHVGYYPTAEEAARAYDRKALLFMGPSAITNFPAADYDGVNLEADGSVEEQVKPCIGVPLPLSACLGCEKRLSGFVRSGVHTLQHTLNACLGDLLLVLSCTLLHVGCLHFWCASHIGTHLADEEAEKDKDIAVQGSHQGWSQVEGRHQDEQHQAGAGHL